MDTYTKVGTAWLRYAAILLMLFTLVPALPAQEIMEETVAVSEPVLDSGNTAWILTSSLLVLLMSIPGIALFYGGLVRQKNVLSVIMQTLFIVGVVSILWIAFGYSWAFDTSFAESGNPLACVIGGFDKAFLHGITLDTLTTGQIPEVHVRHHHSGSDIGRIRRAHQVFGLHRIHRVMDHSGLFPHGTLGMGRRIPSGNGRH